MRYVKLLMALAVWSLASACLIGDFERCESNLQCPQGKYCLASAKLCLPRNDGGLEDIDEASDRRVEDNSTMDGPLDGAPERDASADRSLPEMDLTEGGIGLDSPPGQDIRADREPQGLDRPVGQDVRDDRETLPPGDVPGDWASDMAEDALQSWDGPGGGTDLCVKSELVETTCDDGLDNDCDGLVDCHDPHCGNARCGEHGRICQNTVCQCLSGSATETACTDSLDDDCDGLKDCQDTDCQGGPPCLNVEICADGLDNNEDGMIDCEDIDCLGDPCGPLGLVCLDYVCVCPLGELDGEASCRDGQDNDCDGQDDCQDEDCLGDPCAAHGKICSNGACSCPGGLVIETNYCADQLDNDCDGLEDCEDTDCDADGACRVEEDCDDHIDNDGDTLTDCDDPECAKETACQGGNLCLEAALGFDPISTVVSCSDADTETSCAYDFSSFLFDELWTYTCNHMCAFLGLGCVGAYEGEFPSCATNGVLWSCDTAASDVTGYDLHCHCERPGDVGEEICNDTMDNDGDGLMDCDDFDCREAAECG